MKASAFLGLVLVLVMLLPSGGRVAADPPPGQGGVGAQAVLGSAFTYQGYLKQSGSAVTGACDFRFILYDAEIGGSQIGSTETKAEVGVSGGLFTAQLDFGASAFSGQARWLEIGVRCPAGSGTYSTLSPRQALTATPYALYAPTAGAATSAITATTATTATTAVTATSATTATTATAAPWSGLSGVPAGFADGLDNDSDHSSTYWSLTGNAGTISGTNFLGTTDNVTLTLGVSGTAALRLEPNATSPNLIGGFSGNTVTSGVVGATVGGGGASANTNTVTDDYGTVGGGRNNRAGDNAGTTALMAYATVGGGASNTASGLEATVAGGLSNTASGVRATVGGGSSNTASGAASTLAGGSTNTASGEDATVGGGLSNTASGLNATVGGGESNTASGLSATVGGGFFNAASGDHATVGGGRSNSAAGDYATAGGGSSNTASGTSATVGGGESNVAAGAYSFAAGRRAKIDAAHGGSLLFADSTNADFNSGAANQFAVRAIGGVWFGTTNTANIAGGRFIDTSTGGYLTTGGAWTNASDRGAKQSFAPVDQREVLSRLMSLPIQTWSYRAEDSAIVHMGPTGQDFYGAFGLGGSTAGIGTVDADGVALAAIQGLYQALQDRDARISQLEARLAALEGRLAGGGGQ